MSYFSPCGYVAPAYYDNKDSGWLKSFTAGFLTTCGLEAVGSPCVDEGESFPLHGTIANTPAEHVYWLEEQDELVIRADVLDEVLFARKLRLHRELRISLTDNSFKIIDTIENAGDTIQPFEILYHMNMGYPLLDEDSIVKIPAASVRGRDELAQQDVGIWNQMCKPESGYVERCFYHTFEKDARASIFQPKLGQGLEISFDCKELDCFTEWKMMGIRDYVLGLECGNCYPDGRDVMRQTGILKFLEPGESKTYTVQIRMLDEEPV